MVFFFSSSSSSSDAAVPPSQMSVSPVQKCILQRSFLGGSKSKKNKKISCFKQISSNQENLKGYNKYSRFLFISYQNNEDLDQQQRVVSGTCTICGNRKCQRHR